MVPLQQTSTGLYFLTSGWFLAAVSKLASSNFTIHRLCSFCNFVFLWHTMITQWSKPMMSPRAKWPEEVFVEFVPPVFIDLTPTVETCIFKALHNLAPPYVFEDLSLADTLLLLCLLAHSCPRWGPKPHVTFWNSLPRIHFDQPTLILPFSCCLLTKLCFWHLISLYFIYVLCLPANQS